MRCAKRRRWRVNQTHPTSEFWRTACVDRGRSQSDPLKTLQGLIWEGYLRTGLQVSCPDVVPVLRAWHAAGLRLYVYSSGSVVAQKVLFAHTADGDLTPLFSGYFDTTTGPKQERASYEAIARTTGDAPATMLFLSDVDAELDAARAAGMQTARLLRPADTPPGAHTNHAGFTTFDELARALTPEISATL